MADVRQIPTLVLPTLAVQTQTGATTHTIGDALQHVSDSFASWSMQEKIVYVYAVAAGGVAPLNVWIELAPYDVAANYVALGVPTPIVATRSVILQWTTHSEFARIVSQCLGWVAGTWTISIIWEAKP